PDRGFGSRVGPTEVVRAVSIPVDLVFAQRRGARRGSVFDETLGDQLVESAAHSALVGVRKRLGDGIDITRAIRKLKQLPEEFVCAVLNIRRNAVLRRAEPDDSGPVALDLKHTLDPRTNQRRRS